MQSKNQGGPEEVTRKLDSACNWNAALDDLQWFCWHLREMRLLGYSFGDRLPWIMQPIVSTLFVTVEPQKPYT